MPASRRMLLATTLATAVTFGVCVTPASAAPFDPPRTLCSHTNSNNSVEDITINCPAAPGNVIGFSWYSPQATYVYVIKAGGGSYYSTFSGAGNSGNHCVSVVAGQTFKLSATNLGQNGFIQAKVAC